MMELGLKVKTESNQGKYLLMCLFKRFYACLTSAKLTSEMVNENK